MTTKHWAVLAGVIALCKAVGVAGSIFTAQAIPEWYAFLNKPSFSPPNWLFGPVWVTLYALMGIAAFLVWRKAGMGQALGVFALQLALNAAWSPIFFGLQNPLLGLVCIVAMWLAIVWTIVQFGRVSRAAALLLVPYLLWVSFATVLNLSIVLLN
jgi:benzodiazapine receptor